MAEVEPAARPTAAFDIHDAEQLLVRAFEESNGRDHDRGRPQEQDAGAGRLIRRAQLRMPELPCVPGHAAAASADR